MKPFSKYGHFDDAASPIVESFALGGDGIRIIEIGDDDKLKRCLLYEDKGIPRESRYTNHDIFFKNQWSELVHSWGPNGTILPHSISSNTYKSLLDDEGIGIICPYDELWYSAYWYARGAGTNYAHHFLEVQFRPRQIRKTDLLEKMIKRNCCRPCDEPESVDELPCPESCKDACGLKDTNKVSDDEIIKLPEGQTVTGKDYKMKLDDRKSKFCLDVCVVNDLPIKVDEENKVARLVRIGEIDPQISQANCLPVKICGSSADNVKLDWKNVSDVFRLLSNTWLEGTDDWLKQKGLDINYCNKQITACREFMTDMQKALDLRYDKPNQDNTAQYISILRSIDFQRQTYYNDPELLNDPVDIGCISKNPRNTDLSSRKPLTPNFPLVFVWMHIIEHIVRSRLMEDCVKYRKDAAKSDMFTATYLFDPWFPPMNKNALFLCKDNKSPFGDNEYARFMAELSARVGFLAETKKVCKSLLQEDNGSTDPPETGHTDTEETPEFTVEGGPGNSGMGPRTPPGDPDGDIQPSQEESMDASEF